VSWPFSHSFPYQELFGSVAGIAAAVVASLAAIGTAVFGFKRFQLPYDPNDGFPRGIANFILFGPFVLCFMFITPQNATHAAVLALIGVPLAYIFFNLYNLTLRNHRFIKPVPAGWMFWKSERELIIVGGTELTPVASQRKQHTNESEQHMLATAAYDPDEIWERPSRTNVQLRVELWFYCFLLLAVTCVVTWSLALQAVVSKTAPRDAAAKLWTSYHPDEPEPGPKSGN
jgi:hypothetical protein